LPVLLDAMRDECEKIGRDPGEIELTTAAGNLDPGRVRQYEDAVGASRMMIMPPARDADGIKRGLTEFADNVMSKV